jgi:cephalosporin hydroxylase
MQAYWHRGFGRCRTLGGQRLDFSNEVQNRIDENGNNEPLKAAAHSFLMESVGPKYSYNFSWLGRPIIQYPQDMVAVQELIWRIQPDLIIETGIAHGGSLIFSASILELVSLCGGQEGEVLGIDVDIRPHNRKAIEAHPMARRISMIEGSSLDAGVIARVREKAKDKGRILVFLDSNHTHDHVLAELDAYGGLTSIGSYCVVFDTLIEDMPDGAYPDRPWGRGNNPKTAVWEWLISHPEFQIDKSIPNKLLITVAPDGFLQRIG